MRIILSLLMAIHFLSATIYADDEKLFTWQASPDEQLRTPLAQTIPSGVYSTTQGNINFPDIAQSKPFLIAVRDPDCPVSRRYSPYLQKLQSSDLKVIYLLSGKLASKSVAQRDIQRHQLEGTYILDAENKLSEWLGVRTSSEVYLFDDTARLRYRGAIDDRFGIGFTRPKANQNFLDDALNAVHAGVAVNIPVTSAPGCIVHAPTLKSSSGDVTWHKQVSRIMEAKCQLCHRPGQAGPFPLQTYEQVTLRKGMIRYVLENNIMPPWFAAGDTQRWVGDRHLAANDRKLLIDWIDAGAPKGDVKDAAIARKWESGWQLGEPDIVLTSPQTLHVPAEGEIAYKYISIPTDFAEDRWVQSIEVSTDTPQNTHHIIIFILPPDSLQNQFLPGVGEKRRLSRKEMHLLTLRGFFGGYVQGLPGVRYQEGAAKLLPKGWQLLMQIHHEANGVAAQDKPRIGIQFSKQPPSNIIETFAAANKDLNIPPGASNHIETAEYKFDKDGQIFGLFPHTHLRGTAFRYELHQATGVKKILLDVPRYNPNWQLYYQFKEPIKVEAGSTLRASAEYDNSKENPNNPDPNVEVNFGLRTRDEMMIGYFDWVEAK